MLQLWQLGFDGGQEGMVVEVSVNGGDEVLGEGKKGGRDMDGGGCLILIIQCTTWECITSYGNV